MIGFLGAAYPWVLAAHIIFVIFLMAGLFMLPRFFVYHQESGPGSDEDRKWMERERKLIAIILNPSLVIVWVLGLALAFQVDAWSQGWFHLKLLLVLALSAYHGWAVGYAKALARGERRLPDKRLRLLNELPGIFAAVIVVTVVVGTRGGF
jgi:putative membrane protein